MVGECVTQLGNVDSVGTKQLAWVWFCDTDGDEEVLWVAGLTRSEAFRVTGETDRILYLEFVDAGSPESDAPNPLTDGPMD